MFVSDNYTWEEMPQFADDGGESCPCSRAGHTAAVVGTRMYVWSGREGYKKMWNNQVGVIKCHSQCPVLALPMSCLVIRFAVMTSGSWKQRSHQLPLAYNW